MPVYLACGKVPSEELNLDTKRISDIEKLLDGLDITFTMFKNATDKYQRLAAYFESKGFECDIYPFGSFSLGTVVRPYRGEEEPLYDLDFICCVHKAKSEADPKRVKHSVKDQLVQNETYKRILCDHEWEKCWTMEYAEVDGVGFNMDIVPAAVDGAVSMLVEDNGQIVITNKSKSGNYNWIPSNPKAYRKWFEEINAPFMAYRREERLAMLLESKSVYNKVEDIPPQMERSALQRVIQLLKRHRDVHFSKAGVSNKPISVIITTLTAQIASETNAELDFFPLLDHVVRELQIYSKQQVLNEAQFAATYHTKVRIKRSSSGWWIGNPVDPSDNLAESWNEEPKNAKAFFKWIDQLAVDFLDSIKENDEQFIASMGNAFGPKYVQASEVRKRYRAETPKSLSLKPKQWGQK